MTCSDCENEAEWCPCTACLRAFVEEIERGAIEKAAERVAEFSRVYAMDGSKRRAVLTAAAMLREWVNPTPRVPETAAMAEAKEKP